MITKQFLTAGRAIFKVTNPEEESYTFRIRRHKNEPILFVCLLTRPGQSGSGLSVPMGVFNIHTGNVYLNYGTRFNEDHLPVKVFRWATAMVYDQHELPPGYSIEHVGRCGGCGSVLRSPESLSRGLGPECASRLEGVLA